ncbi:Ig-like domain-containing protein [Reichenbachiella sp.]
MNLFSTKQLEKIKEQWSYIDKVLLSILIFTICLAMTFVAAAQAPTAVSLDPINGSTTYPSDNMLFVIEFDEDVRGLSGFIYLKDASKNIVHASVRGNSVNISDNLAIIDFDVDGTVTNVMTADKEYYIEVTSTAFEDLDGNDFSGIDAGTWSFTTRSSEFPPSIQSLIPAFRTTHEKNDPLIAIFDEPIQKNSGTAEIRILDFGSRKVFRKLTVGDWTVVGSRVIIPDQDLDHNTTYYIEIDEDAFEDYSQNAFPGISGDETWRFTAEDQIDPYIVSRTPAIGATGVDLTPSLVTTFSEPMDYADLNAQFYLRKSSNNSIAYSWTANPSGGTISEDYTISGNQVTFEVPESEAWRMDHNTSYYLSGHAIADENGNTVYPWGSSWQFTTRAAYIDTEVLSANIPGLVGDPVIDNENNTITATVQATNPSRIDIDLDLSPGATYSFSSNPQYYQNGVPFPMTVRAEANNFESWTITLNWEELQGNYTVGDNGTFATITDAVGQLGLAGMSGDVVFEVEDGYNVTKTVFLSNPDPDHHVTIRPQAGATQIDLYPESNYGAVFRINDVISNMTIDGADPSTGNVVMNVNADIDGVEGVNFYGSGAYDFTLQNLRFYILNSAGIRMNNQFASMSGVDILGCEFIAANTASNAQIMGLQLEPSTLSNINVIGNKFYNQAGAPDPYIYYAIVAGDELNNVINNSISIRGNRTVGISKATNILHNSIHFYGSSVENNESHNAIGTGENIQNNNVSITRTSGSDSYKGFVQLSTIQEEDAGNNVYIADDGVSATGYAQNASSQSEMSAIASTTTFINAQFTNGTHADLSLAGLSLDDKDLRTTPIAEVSDDIEGVVRSLYTVSRGAFEAPNKYTDMLTFSLVEESEEAVIDTENGTVDIEVVATTDLTALSPTITLFPGSTVSPESGVETDFSSPVVYTVTAEDGVTIQEYTVTVTRLPNTETDITLWTFPEQTSPAVIDAEAHTVTIEVNGFAGGSSGRNRLTPTIELSFGASVSPISGGFGYFNHNVPTLYTVTAEDGTTVQEWQIIVTYAPFAGGTYTIGSNQDFLTPIDAAARISRSGITGDVVLEMQESFSGSSVLLDRFEGTAEHSLTLTVSNDASDLELSIYNIRLRGVENFVFDGKDNLKVIKASNGSAMNISPLNEFDSDNIQIRNITFSGNGGSSNATNLIVENCTFDTENSGSLSIYSAFNSTGGSSIIRNNQVIVGSEINQPNILVQGFYSTAGEVYNNFIHINPTIVDRVWGIAYNAGSDVNIHHNTIVIAGSSSGDEDLNALYETSARDNAVTIHNNIVSIIRNPGTNGSKTGHRLAPRFGETPKPNYAHNNFYLEDNAGTLAYVEDGGTSYDDSNFSDLQDLVEGITRTEPEFTNIATSDLTLAGSSLTESDFRGIPIASVTTDYFGTDRHTTYPSKGAHEAPNRTSDFVSFSIPNQYKETVIDGTAHTVAVEIVPGNDVTSLAPTFTISPGASIAPSGSGVARDFTNQVTYQITDEQEYAQQTWTVTVSEGDLPPQTNDFSPSQGEMQVLINASVSLGFDEPTTLGTGSIHLYKEGQLEESVDVTSPQVNHTSVTYNSILNIQFTNEFEPETSYTILVDAGVVKDDQDQDFEGISSHDVWSFTTMDNESDAPVWNYEYPEDGMVDISAADLVEDGIYFEFNEPIRKGTGNIQIFNAANDQLIKTINVTDENNEVTDEGIDLYGVGLLPTSTEVYVLVCDGCITDILGNPYGGNSPGDWSFTTAGPRITGLSPADDAIQVGVEENLVITFNENVQYSGNSGSVSIYKSDDTPVETIYLNNSSKVSFLDNTLTVNPDAVLEGSTSYYVQITGTGIEGVDNSIEFNGLDDETTWTFTTVDNINPTITAFSPNIDDIKVPNNAPIVLTMSEPVQLSGNPNADIRIRNLSNPGTIYRTIDPASGQVIIEDNVVTIQPTGGMLSGAAEVEVYVGWSTTPFEDLVGNDLNELFNSDFKFTVDNLPPSMDISSPENTATEVAVNVGQLSLTLSENVVAGAGSFELVTGADNVVKTFYMGTADVNVSGSTVTLNNVPLLSNLTTYWVRNNNTGANAIMDVANNGLDSWTTNATWSFTTEEALIVSDFSTEAPVALDANLSVTYNKPVQEGTGSYYLRDGSGQLIETFAIDGPKVTINESTVTLNPDNNLIYHTNYRVEAFAGVVKDMSDRPSIELTSEDWVFNSVGIISTLSPADDATDVSPFADLVITFDAPVQVKTGGAFRVFRTADNQQLGNTWSFNSATVEGNTLTFNSPLDIEPGVDVYIDILGGIEDLDENPIDIRGNGTWNFTTVKQSQTVDFAALDTKTFGDGTYTFVAATASSGLAIEYSSDDEEVATVSGNQITIHGAGVTTITATQAGNTFYHDADSEQTLTVDKATKAITFTIPDKTYGDEIFTLSAVLTPTDDEITFQLTEGDDASLDSETNEVTILGAGSVTFTATSPESDNYLAATPVDYELDIQKKVLTARADNQSREYGESNPDLTLSFDGFIEGENASDLSGTLPSRTTEADENSTVGEYTITVAGGSDVNYEFQNENGTLTITKAELDTYAVSLIKNYGDDNPELELELVGFKNEETLAVINALPVVATQASKYSDAGNHVITVTGGEDDNYSFNYINGTLAIGKVALTATVQDVEKVYGQANPEFVIEYVGFVSGEDDASLDLPMVVTTTADENSNVGEYVLDLQDQEDTNYEINTIDGTLTITKAEQIVEIQDITDKVINATPFDIVASVNSDTELQYAVSGHATNSGKTITLTGTIGTVIVTVTAPASLNYLADSEQVSFEVNDKQTQQITFNVEDQTYGGEVGLSGTSDSSLPVSYEIVSGPLALNNGVLSFTGVGAASVRALQSGDETYNEAEPVIAEFTIAKAALTVTAEDQSMTYGDEVPTLSFSYDGFVNEEDATALIEIPVASTLASESSDAGTYDISLSGGTADNYELILVKGTLTIEKAVATVTLSNLNFDEDGTAKSPTVVTDPVDLNVILSYDGADAAPSEAGTYEVVATIDETNYQGTATATLTINEVTVTGVQLTATSISVYPNPTSDWIAVSGLTDKLTRLSLVDIDGRVVLSQQVTPKEKINVTSLKAGLYLLQLDQNDFTTTTKILIQ